MPDIRPPADPQARRWWDQGTRDEAACHDAGLTLDVRQVRDFLEALARRTDHPVTDAASMVERLAIVFLAGQPLRRRVRLAWRLVRS